MTPHTWVIVLNIHTAMDKNPRYLGLLYCNSSCAKAGGFLNLLS